MKKISLIAAIAVVAAQSAFAVTNVEASFIRLDRGEKPVKENGIYVVPSHEKESDKSVEGIQLPSKKTRMSETGKAVFRTCPCQRYDRHVCSDAW